MYQMLFCLAVCILHNICEIDGDEFNEEWIEDSELDQPDDTTTPAITQNGTQ